MHVVKVLSGWVGMCVFVQYVSIISLKYNKCYNFIFYKCYIKLNFFIKTVWDMASI